MLIGSLAIELPGLLDHQPEFLHARLGHEVRPQLYLCLGREQRRADYGITGITDSVDNGRSVSYTYDALARITAAITVGSANYPQWGLSWTYDAYGNRLAQTVTAGSAPANLVAVSAATNRITTTGYSTHTALTDPR